METHASIVWETANRVIFLDRTAHPEDAQMTEQEFKTILGKMTPQVDFRGFDHYFRYNWLVENGYAVTHENMIDITLPTIPDKINSKPELVAVYDNLPQAFYDKKDELEQQLAKLNTVIEIAKQDPTKTATLADAALQDIAGV